MPRRGEKLRKTWIGFDSILDRHGDDSVSNRDAARSPDQRNRKLQYGRSRIADIEHVDPQQCQVDGEYSLCRQIIGGNLGARAASAGAVAPIGVNVIALLFLAVASWGQVIMPMPTIKTAIPCKFHVASPLRNFCRTVCTELRTGGVNLAVPRLTHKNSGVDKFYFVAINELRIYSVAL